MNWTYDDVPCPAKPPEIEREVITKDSVIELVRDRFKELLVEPCPWCNGTGSMPMSKYMGSCRYCLGSTVLLSDVSHTILDLVRKNLNIEVVL